MTTNATPPAKILPRWIVLGLSRLLSLLVPILLLLLSVRVVLTPIYVTTLYQMPFFPADRYGWDESVRLEYGPYGVRYLLNDAGIEYLGDLEIEGQPAFIQSELDHMEDVKVVTRAAMCVLYLAFALFLLISIAFYIDRTARLEWLKALVRGGITTLTLIFSLMLMAVFSWDFFFDTFHSLFFADGTWQFYRSDTLIRLYPQTFWFTSSLVVGVITIGGALGCMALPKFYQLRVNP